MLKRIVALLAVGLMVSADADAQKVSASSQTVRKHTALKFVLLQPLSSATAKVGDDVPLRLARPLVASGATLLPVGEIAYGQVTKVKPAKKCRDGQLEWEFSRISFADSTTAKTKLLFVSARPDFPVDDSYSHRPSAGSPDLNTKDALGLFVMTLVVLPFLLLSMLFEHDRGDCSFGGEYFLPANSTVVVVITRDHRVRY